MSDEPKEANTLKQNSYAQGDRFIRGGSGGVSPVASSEFALPTAVHLEKIEARLTEQNALLAEVRDHLVSLRVDMGPMADYFASIMKAAQDQEAEAEHLPIGFPAADKLEEAGITAVTDVPRKSSALRRLGLTPDEVTEVLASLMHDHNTL